METSARGSGSGPSSDPAGARATTGSTSTSAPAIKRDADGDETMESPRDAAEPPRWNRDEHARFMQALEAYGGERTGDEWHKIAAFVQTRSLEEVRVHGQQYLQHLVQIHQLQQHHHLQLQQQRLLQLSRLGQAAAAGEALLSPFLAAPLSSRGDNQNDPNGPNSNTKPAASARGKAAASKDLSERGAIQPSPLSLAAQAAANAMNAHVLVRPSDAQPVVVARKSVVPAPAATAAARGKLKTWSFQEDKVLETALATWQRGKPYSWPKIATSLPGKTAKDVRLRYEQLVEDVASIDKGGGLSSATSPATPPLPPKIPPPAATTTTTTGGASSSATASSSSTLTPSGRPPTHSGLSSRISPPPPIQVPPPATRGKTESPGVFPGSARGRFAMTPSFGGASGMLSPTFLDFLASEDKPPMPAFAGLSDLASPLLTSRGGVGGDGSSLLLSPMAMDLNTPGGARGRRSLITPRGPATPRIWHDFLADDFKFDAKAGPSPSASRPPTSASASSVPPSTSETSTSTSAAATTATSTATTTEDSDARRLGDVKTE